MSIIKQAQECDDMLGLQLSQVETMTDWELKDALYPQVVIERENTLDVEYLDREMRSNRCLWRYLLLEL